MEKPVIILGGGIWGSLLAYRLKQALPEIEFRLYESSSTLGQHQGCSFRESDCKESLHWLRPLISKSWKQHHIKLDKFEKWITDPYHLIESQFMHDMIYSQLGPDVVKLNNRMTTEMALQEGAFVIDARNICHFRKKAYRKCLSLEVELDDEHHMIAPVIYDGGVETRETHRNLHYLPVSEKRILIKDFWYSSNPQLNLEEMRLTLTKTMIERGWKISRVIREDINTSSIPLSSPVVRQEGRVINLAGMFHDLTGCSIPAATKLIDRMVSTSFRLGELKEVVKTFREESENDRKFFRFLNQQLMEKNQPQLFEAIYKQPYPTLERYSRGQLSLFDRYRILMSKSNYNVAHLIQCMMPSMNFLKLSNV